MRISVVTSNPGKLKEFMSALHPLGIEIDHSTEDCDEIQADRLEEVVHHCLNELECKGLRNFVIDDSGLFVHSLGGFPGVYSSYVFRTIGNSGLLKLFKDDGDRSAHFECCIGCSLDGIGKFIVKERCDGKIIEEERGKEGFGFDPIFAADGFDLTFAQMTMEQKNLISHRGRALSSFAKELTRRMKGGYE